MEIDGKTRVVVHLAYPAAHLRTPQLFNARCRERGINAVLVPWQVHPDNLAATVEALRISESVDGMIVTMPHKEMVAGLCDELAGVASGLHVVNAIRKAQGGRFVGRIMDGEGFVQGLLDAGHEITGKKVLLAGAGGVAVAIAEALVAGGAATLTVTNRTRRRAEDLVGRVKALHPDVALFVGGPDARGMDLVINATALGMHAGEPLPVDVETIGPGSVVAEVVMDPEETELLKQAEKRGAIPHRGELMLKGQIDRFIDFVLATGNEAESA